MRRALVVAFAVIMGVLAATAPAAASHGSVVISAHTTDTDFGGATLSNMTVSGSGASASVTTGSLTTFDDFEDGDVSEYGGDTAEATVTGTNPIEGSFTLEMTASTSEDIISSTTGLADYPAPGDVFVVTMAPAGSFSNPRFFFATQSESTSSLSGYFVDLRTASDEVQIVRIDSGSVTVLADDTSTPLAANVEYNATVDWQADGTISVTVVHENGTQVGQVSTSDSTYTSGGIGFQERNVGSTARFDFVRTTPQFPASYVHSHVAENTERGFVDLSTVTDATVTVTYRGDSNGDGSFDTLLNQTSGITTVANHTFTWSAFAGEEVQVNVTAESTGSLSVVTMDAEGVFADAAAPTVDNGSASPTGTLTTASPTLSIAVNDSDFPLAQGDTVTVEFFTNRSGSVGTDTLTSNGTASTTITAAGGTTDWWAVATDSSGHTATSANFTFTAPSELRIFNESAPSQLVNDTTVELRFYRDELTDSPQIFTRTTSDGTVDMSGLPTDEPFIVVAMADGYHDRRIFVPSLFETQSIYLLPENETGADTLFAIKDYSGDFPQESTVLLVQRSINGTYRTVLGDYFGATSQFPAVLELGVRHRLVLMNVETGETLQLGTYTPLTAATQEVTVSPEGTVEVERTDVTIDVDPATRTLPALPAARIGVGVDGGANSTVANWSATATLINDSGSTVLWTHSASSSGSVTQALDLTDQGGGQVVVNVSATTVSGATSTASVTFAISQTFDNDGSFLAVTGRLVDLSPPRHQQDFTMFLAIAISIFVMGGLATQLRLSGEETAFAGVLSIAGFAVIGWAPMELVFVTAVGFASFAAYRRGL